MPLTVGRNLMHYYMGMFCEDWLATCVALEMRCMMALVYMEVMLVCHFYYLNWTVANHLAARIGNIFYSLYRGSHMSDHVI